MQQNPVTNPGEAMTLAREHEARGNLSEAERIYRDVVAVFPEFHPAYHGLGLLAYGAGKMSLAIDLISHAIELDGNVARYHGNLCEILRRAKKLQKALVSGKKATELAPDNADFWYNLGLVLSDRSDWPAAERTYLKAIQLNPRYGLAYNNLGTVLEKLGKVDAALAAYQQAITINPEHAEAQNNAGAIYSERGQLDCACECFSSAIRAQPDFLEPYYNASSLKTFAVDDPHLQGLEKLHDRVNEMPVDAQVRYHFALGKAYEDIADYEGAFTAYKKGNDLQFSRINYNDSRAEESIERIVRIFDTELFRTYHDSGIVDDAPVFIAGMPRSGTTLIEQILASHQDVYGAGELKDLHEIITSSSKSDREGGWFGRCEPGLPGFDLHGMADEYLRRLHRLAPEARRVTDKMPANFFYIGFIHIMFPRARIIHAMRDPMDSCFSCYARLFKETMDFTYSLRTLGNYYVRYMQLMRHWHEVLPAGTILDVRYEDVVADVESQTRRLLDHIGLSWDPSCLEFHNNERQVRTASVAQVRRPIYQTSIGRWRHFEKHLDPLRTIVEQYRTPDNCNIHE